MQRGNHLYWVVALALTLVIYKLVSSTEAQEEVRNKLDASFLQKPTGDVASTSIETTIPGGQVVHGFSLLDRLYLRKGTFYIVTSNPSTFPSTRNMISRPLDIVEGVDIQPTERELRVITPDEAKGLLGERAVVVDGLSWVVYGTEQYMDYFYHWWGEIMLGACRVHSALSSSKSSDIPPSPARVVLPQIFHHEWRDKLGLNAPLMRAIFPSTSIDQFDYWNDLLRLDKTFVFERAMIISRAAAETHDNFKQWRTMTSSTMTLDVPTAFWESIRRTALQNVLGYVPKVNRHGVIISPPSVVSEIPFVTYIVRQGGPRRLAELDHESLVEALHELERDGVCQVYIVEMEKLSLEEQLEVAAKSTVLVGVHGNGLTHQLWMPPSSRSSVIEIFAPESYVHQHELIARSLGHKHYIVWNDTFTTLSETDSFHGVRYTNDFHGLSIPVHGKAIARLIKQRLT